MMVKDDFMSWATAEIRLFLSRSRAFSTEISCRVSTPSQQLAFLVEQGPGWNVGDVASALGMSSRAIEHLKKRFVLQGLEAALARKVREKTPREARFDGALEARLIALVCSEAPQGYRRWTVRLLADKAVELKFADSVSHMSVQRVLKKTNFSPTGASTGKSRRKAARPS
ncbi:MAG: helix-turn-helix domain-containing protein [Desulfobacteraceae bacterium]|nr:MAG: helix-turn-helix domain-containing protein [Desulfobacteraceae bacterium]